MGKTRDSRLVGARTEGGRGGGGGALPKGKEFLIGGDTVVLKLGSSDDWATCCTKSHYTGHFQSEF